MAKAVFTKSKLTNHVLDYPDLGGKCKGCVLCIDICRSLVSHHGRYTRNTTIGSIRMMIAMVNMMMIY